jgi:threonine/homoserine/homoserine lactone efflux protein
MPLAVSTDAPAIAWLLFVVIGAVLLLNRRAISRVFVAHPFVRPLVRERWAPTLERGVGVFLAGFSGVFLGIALLGFFVALLQ